MPADGTPDITISGNGTKRIVFAGDEASAVLIGLGFRGGHHSGLLDLGHDLSGGAIASSGRLAIIHSLGLLVITDSTFSNSRAFPGGANVAASVGYNSGIQYHHCQLRHSDMHFTPIVDHPIVELSRGCQVAIM